MQFIKSLIRNNATLHRSAKYIKAELITKKIDHAAYVKAKLQRNLASLSEIIRDNNLAGGFMTDGGEYYIKTNDLIWMYYNFEDHNYTNGDGQNLEFKSSHAKYILEDFVLNYLGNGMCYLDVGANNGYYYSLKVAKKFKDCKIFSFEPDPSILYHLRKNVTFNGFDNIKIETLALSDKDCTARLTANLGASGFLVVDDAIAAPTIDVTCTTLDNYVVNNNLINIDLIKVDIEGGEFNFIKGARTVLNKCRPVLILELSENLLKRSMTTFEEVKKYLAGCNYVLAKVNVSDDFIAIPREKTAHVINTNNSWLELQ